MRLLLAVLCLAPLTHCAFLNTLYNARTAFNEGYRVHRKQMREHPDSLLAPVGAVLAKYDRTIAKCQKVFEVYPRRVRWHDDALFLMGRAYFKKREMSSAVRQFRRLQEEFPQSPFVAESYYYLAQAYIYDERYQRAEEVLELILRHYPELNHDEKITLLQARLALRREGKAQAVELLQVALKTVKTTQRRLELLITIGELYRDLRQCPRAIEQMKTAPRDRDYPELLYRVDLLTLQCLMDLERMQEARALVESMLRVKWYAAYDAPLQLKKALILVGLDRTDEAMTALEVITERHAGTPEAAQAWYELAVLYHYVELDMVRATECYRKAAALSTDTLYARAASRRAEALSRIDTLRSRAAAPVDSVDSARTAAQWAALTGELFWLELGQPDSALLQYRAVLRDSARGDTLDATALFAIGYLSLHALGDTSAADSVFGLLLERYPSSEHGKRAQMELGREVTVMTREDSAEAAFARAEAIYLDQQDAVGAVEAYLRVFNDYDDCDAGPRGLYAAAYLSDNVTFSKELAQFLYRKVCERYPATAYCQEASRPRLRAAADSTLLQREREQSTHEQPSGRSRAKR